MNLHVTCNRCQKPFTVDYKPDEFVSERLVRLTAVCDDCKRKRTWLPKIEPTETRKPYRED